MERPKGSLSLDDLEPVHYDITLKPSLEKKPINQRIVEVRRLALSAARIRLHLLLGRYAMRALMADSLTLLPPLDLIGLRRARCTSPSASRRR